jgi:cardiolipin synthase
MQFTKREVLTVPNGLTLIRAFGVPIFLWLLLGENLKGWSYLVLVIGACTDYLDGKVARWLNQESKLGAAMDPTIDRLYIGATIIGLALKHFIPWWMVLILVARDIYMLFLLAAYKRRTGQVFVVTFLGKAATFNLLYAFPFFLLSSGSRWGEFAHSFGWGFAIWGIGLYLLAAVDYSRIAFTQMRRTDV